MTHNQTLVNILGNLKDAYKQCVPGTMLCVDQLITEYRSNLELRPKWFYTADGIVYSLDNGVPTLRITREATNPILKNIGDAFRQLDEKKNYHILPADFDAVKAATDTVTIDLTKLKLQREKQENLYYSIRENRYPADLNPEEQKLIERLYGQSNECVQNMQMMQMMRDKSTNPNPNPETLIYLLDPQYVIEHAKEGPIGRGSWLNELSYLSYWNMIDSISSVGCLRGVLQ